MRELFGVSLRRVAILRRAAAALALASLLSLLGAQVLHPGAAFAARGASAPAASLAAVDSAPAPHQTAHLPSLCSICRALAQTRLGVRSPMIATPDRVDAALRVSPAPPDTLRLAPWRASTGPRAPPCALPIQHS